MSDFRSCIKCQRPFSGKACLFCQRASARRWKKANTERVRQYRREWGKVNPDKIRQNQRASYQRHSEKRRAYQREWSKAKTEKKAWGEIKKNKEARKKERGGGNSPNVELSSIPNKRPCSGKARSERVIP